MDERVCSKKENNIASMIDSVDLSFAYRCNLRCQMCYFWRNNPFRDEDVLTIEEWKAVMREIKELPKKKDFWLNGDGPGEVFLREGIFSVISLARELDLRMKIISNGYLLDEITAQKISDSGLEYLSLSLDSLKPKTHDFLRGVNGSLEKVLCAVKNIGFFSKNTRININCVISRINMNDINDLVRWVQATDAVSCINFQAITQPFSFTHLHDESWFQRSDYSFLWPDDMRVVDDTIELLIASKSEGGKIANSIAQLNAYRSYFLNPSMFIKENKCNLGSGRRLAIDSGGNVSICQLIGNIGTVKNGKSLQQIINSSLVEEHKREINKCRRNCHLIVSCFFEEDKQEGYK